MHSHWVVFFHVLSAFVWVGGMIVIRLVVHPALAGIEDPKIKLGKTLEITGRLFHLVIPFILILLATGLLMALAQDGHQSALASLFFSKELIWTVMTMNFSYMYLQRHAAWKLFEAGRLPEAKSKVKHIPNRLLPLNILLGIVALWLGISLRGL